MELLLFYILQFACDLSGIRKRYPCDLVNPQKIESLECNPAAYTWHCIVQETIGPLGLALILILIGEVEIFSLAACQRLIPTLPQCSLAGLIYPPLRVLPEELNNHCIMGIDSKGILYRTHKVLYHR